MLQFILAHGTEVHHATEVAPAPHDVLNTWPLEPGVVIPLLLSAALYGVGQYRLWRSSGRGHGIKGWEAASFWAGWLTLVVALASPLHPWGSVLFSAHMIQHELLMLVAAPLLVLGGPLIAFLWALPAAWSNRLAGWSNAPAWKSSWGVVTNAFVAWVIHAVVLWAWHAPPLFQATLTSEWVHAAQHLAFTGSALLFWWAVIHGRRHALGYGAAVLYMFTTALHSGLLGALLTFAKTLWYPAYRDTTAAWGLTAVEDQQLGGLIMWIPAGLVYVFAGLALFVGWLCESERRVERFEGRAGDRVPTTA